MSSLRLPGLCSSRCRNLALCLAPLMVAGILATYLLWPRKTSPEDPGSNQHSYAPDPRLTYTGPFRNIHPDVTYVGDEACLPCHQDLVASFREHPKGQNFVPVAQQTKPPPEDRAHHNPFEAFGSRFQVERHGQGIRHRQTSLGKDQAGQPLFDTALEVSHAIGSWTNGFSYLNERQGYVFQTPISWFSQKGIWDISPGFQPDVLPGRPVDPPCLFCHANRFVRPVPGSRNRYELPVFDGPLIACERCHGPGQLHITHQASHPTSQARGEVDWTIVNPKHLPPREREAVCQQCHLVGVERVLHPGRVFTDFRPGLPLESVMTVFVEPPQKTGGAKAVTHFEFMIRSRCYLASKGKLSCNTCHDSHRYRTLAERRVYYRQACLACHQEKGCRLPVNDQARKLQGDSCTHCHMPPYSTSSVAHTSTTDHRIVRRPGQGSDPAASPSREVKNLPPLVPFNQEGLDLESPLMIRSVGIAMARQIRKETLPVNPFGRFTLRFLDSTLDGHREDWEAWKAKADVLRMQGDFSTALQVLENLLNQQPGEEVALAHAAYLAGQMNLLDQSEKYWRKALELNPWLPLYRQNLATTLARKQSWDEAALQSQEWLRLDPASLPGHMVLIESLIKTGRPDEAQAQFFRLKALKPPDLDQFEQWYAGLKR